MNSSARLLTAALLLVSVLPLSAADYRLSPELKAITVYAPTPKYPFETDYNRPGGSATARLSVDKQSGAVTKVEITQSTGSTRLDNVVEGTLRKWRFKPGTVSQIDVPIGFGDYNPAASYPYFGTIKAIDQQAGMVTLLSRMGAKLIVAVNPQTRITSRGKNDHGPRPYARHSRDRAGCGHARPQSHRPDDGSEIWHALAAEGRHLPLLMRPASSRSRYFLRV